MNKKITLFFLTILLVFSLVLSACGGAATEEPTSPAEEEAAPAEQEAAPAEEEAPVEEQAEAVMPAEGEPVYVGALLPLSEPGAPQAGQLILRGIELAAEQGDINIGVPNRLFIMMIGAAGGKPDHVRPKFNGFARIVQDLDLDRGRFSGEKSVFQGVCITTTRERQNLPGSRPHPLTLPSQRVSKRVQAASIAASGKA